MTIVTEINTPNTAKSNDVPQFKDDAIATDAVRELVADVFRALDMAYVHSYAFDHSPNDPQRLTLGVEQFADFLKLFCERETATDVLLNVLNCLSYPVLEKQGETLESSLYEIESPLWDGSLTVFTLFFENGKWLTNRPLPDVVTAESVEQVNDEVKESDAVVAFKKAIESTEPFCDVFIGYDVAGSDEAEFGLPFDDSINYADDSVDDDEEEGCYHPADAVSLSGYRYSSMSEAVASADAFEEECRVYATENKALKGVIDDLTRKLYEIAPNTNITFTVKDLALSDLFTADV